MRNLVFKNLTLKNKGRRIISAKETINEDGIITKIDKHLIYIIRESKSTEDQNSKIEHELFITKEKNTCLRTESFLIKMKGGMFANCNSKLYVVNFLHSLKIDLCPAEQIAGK